MRKARIFVTLPTGQKIGYRLALRPYQPFLFVYFRGPDGKKHERSTGERRKFPAQKRALGIIEEEYLRSNQPEPTSGETEILDLPEFTSAEHGETPKFHDLRIARLEAIIPEHGPDPEAPEVNLDDLTPEERLIWTGMKIAVRTGILEQEHIRVIGTAEIKNLANDVNGDREWFKNLARDTEGRVATWLNEQGQTLHAREICGD